MLIIQLKDSLHRGSRRWFISGIYSSSELQGYVNSESGISAFFVFNFLGLGNWVNHVLVFWLLILILNTVKHRYGRLNGAIHGSWFAKRSIHSTGI